MTAIQVCEHVLESQSCHLCRIDLTNPKQYNIKPHYGKGNKRGWIFVDLFSSSVVVLIHKALKPENKIKLESMPLERLIPFCFKLYSKV